MSSEDVSPDPERAQSILDMPEPRCKKELQKCIGMYNYYRIFSKRYAIYIDPFRKLLSDKNKFTWTEKHSEAFQRLKNQFAEHVLLNNYFEDRPFHLQTDASKQGISAVLYQFDNQNNQCIIALVSRCLTSYESNYSTCEIELLAIIFAVIKLRYYLIGQRFILKTDHKSLIFLLKTSFHTSRLIRWTLIMQQYAYDIEHCKGNDNIIADYFSRLSPNSAGLVVPDLNLDNGSGENIKVGKISAVLKFINTWFPYLKRVSEIQKEDSFLKGLRAKIAVNNIENYKIYDEIIFHKSNREQGWRIVIPEILRTKLVYEMHERVGHGGIYKTFCAIKKSFWWKGMKKLERNEKRNEKRLFFVVTCVNESNI